MRIVDAHQKSTYNVGLNNSWVPLAMQRPSPRPRAVAKSATNVSIRRDILQAARASGVNLSATLENALIEKLKETQRQKWREENRESIAAYNEHVAKHGVFSDGGRTF
jgi:antitoxin CcdA